MFCGVLVPYEQITAFWRYWSKSRPVTRGLDNELIAISLLHEPVQLPYWRSSHPGLVGRPSRMYTGGVRYPYPTFWSNMLGISERLHLARIWICQQSRRY